MREIVLVLLLSLFSLHANPPIYNEGVVLGKGVYTSFTSFVINEPYAIPDSLSLLSQIRPDSTVPQYVLRGREDTKPVQYGAIWGYSDGTRTYVAIGNVLGSPILHPLTVRPLYSSYVAFLEYGAKGFHGIEYTSLKKATARLIGTPALFIIDMRTGQEYLLTSRFLKNLFAKGSPNLEVRFKQDKERETKLIYYLEQYIDEKRQEMENQ